MNKKTKIILVVTLGLLFLFGAAFLIFGNKYLSLKFDSKKSGECVSENKPSDQCTAQVEELEGYKEALADCQTSQLNDSIFKLSKDDLDKRTSYRDEELGISFIYPTYWGEVKKDKNEEKIILSFPSLGGGIAIDATDSSKEIPGRGVYWGDIGFDIKNQDDVIGLCKRFSLSISCSVFKNDNGIKMVKEVSNPGTEGGSESDVPSAQYYFYNPNGEYEGVSMSALRLDNREYFSPIEKGFEEMVQSLKFIDSNCPDSFKGLSDLNKGDCYAGMIVKDVKYSYDNENGNTGFAVFSTKASSPLIVSGKYNHHLDDDVFTGGVVCFYPDEGTILPKIDGDDRRRSFCFSNQNKAKESFGPAGSSGRAKISIDNYDYAYTRDRMWDGAILKEVIKKY
jgi:hypothetical protein